jgi:hypothetical protein
MERGLLVGLSPNEESALQRIAQSTQDPLTVQECHIVRSRLIDEAEHEFRLTELGKRRLVMPRNLLQETLKREGEAAFACSVRSAECAYLSFPDERRGDCAIPAPGPQACRALRESAIP